MTGLVTGLVLGLVTGFYDWSGPTVELLPYLGFALVGCLVTGLGVGIAYPQAWPSSLAFAQLAVSDRTPVRLMRFLEDARSRSVLRTVGWSTSSATPACKTAWPTRSQQVDGGPASPVPQQDMPQRPQRNHHPQVPDSSDDG